MKIQHFAILLANLLALLLYFKGDFRTEAERKEDKLCHEAVITDEGKCPYVGQEIGHVWHDYAIGKIYWVCKCPGSVFEWTDVNKLRR